MHYSRLELYISVTNLIQICAVVFAWKSYKHTSLSTFTCRYNICMIRISKTLTETLAQYKEQYALLSYRHLSETIIANRKIIPSRYCYCCFYHVLLLLNSTYIHDSIGARCFAIHHKVYIYTYTQNLVLYGLLFRERTFIGFCPKDYLSIDATKNS